MKIINMKKFIRSILIILGAIFGISLLIAKASLSYTKTNYKTIYVKSGDTLWSIASSLQKDSYYEGKDIRYIVDSIKNINNLTNSNIYINQELKIPLI